MKTVFRVQGFGFEYSIRDWGLGVKTSSHNLQGSDDVARSLVNPLQPLHKLLEGLRFRACGLGFEIWRLRFRACGLRFEIWGLGFCVWDFGCRVWGLGRRVCDLRLRG